MTHLAASEDAEVREEALRGLYELAKSKPAKTKMDDTTEEDEKLKQVLEERINDISLMSSERQLVDSLWTAHYNEPSSLREKGLVVLPGDDVAGHHLEIRNARLTLVTNLRRKGCLALVLECQPIERCLAFVTCLSWFN